MVEQHFIISLTNLPNRSTHINEVLRALCEQNYTNYEVHLNLPISTKFDGEYDFSKPLLSHPRLKIFRVEDVGAITKLYPTLMRVTEKNQRIITVEDDFIYHPDMLMVYNHLLQSDELNEAALCFAGIYPVGGETDGELNCVGCFRPDEYMAVGVMESYKSVSYLRKHFTEEFMSDWYKRYYNDDLIISAWLGYMGIPKYCVPYYGETNYENRMMSFPLIRPVPTPYSGVSHLREPEGGSEASYKKFYNSALGQYLQQ